MTNWRKVVEVIVKHVDEKVWAELFDHYDSDAEQIIERMINKAKVAAEEE